MKSQKYTKDTSLKMNKRYNMGRACFVAYSLNFIQNNTQIDLWPDLKCSQWEVILVSCIMEQLIGGPLKTVFIESRKMQRSEHFCIFNFYCYANFI